MKLWSYGLGSHEIWGRAASLSGKSYVEIQGGPIRDQSIKETLQPAQTHSHVEFWIPSLTRLDPHSIRVPNPGLLPLSDVPWFDWPPRAGVQPWLSILAAHQKQTIADLPALPPLDQDIWAPSGMDELGDALAWAGSGTTGQPRDGWLFQLGAWLVARGHFDQGLDALARSGDDRARALAGRLYLRGKGDAVRALGAFRAIRSQALARHPQLIIERDLALAELGPEGLTERERWLGQVSNSRDEWLIERKAALLLDQRRPEEARALLASTSFQLVHQRYSRTQLWDRATAQRQDTKPPPPNWLGEDDLAQFGAYRQS
jgi:hypothetical protein